MSDKRKAAERTAWKWFSLWVRLRDASSCGVVQCFTCSTIKPFREMQAGHYRSQGARHGLKFNEKNCEPQCVSCNMYKSGNLAIYAERLIQKHGTKIFDELAIANQLFGRISETGYRELAKKYRLLVQARAKEIGARI